MNRGINIFLTNKSINVDNVISNFFAIDQILGKKILVHKVAQPLDLQKMLTLCKCVLSGFS